jgi:hypothetical protein
VTLPSGTAARRATCIEASGAAAIRASARRPLETYMTALSRTLRRVALAATFIVLPALAQAQVPSSSVRPALPDRVSPPIPLGNAKLVLAAPFAVTIYAVNVTVDVEANGKADLNTLELGGSAGEYNRKAITEWLKKTTFRPAKRNGVPTRATFRMSAETLKQSEAPDSSAAAPR